MPPWPIKSAAAGDGRPTTAASSAHNITAAVAGPAGERLAIGSALAAVEAANGKPFSILGFDWDYSGTAADWQGGKLEKAFGGCRLTIRFGYPKDADAKALDRLSGDKEFSSADPDMRLVKPTAYEILLSWPD